MLDPFKRYRCYFTLHSAFIFTQVCVASNRRSEVRKTNAIIERMAEVFEIMCAVTLVGHAAQASLFQLFLSAFPTGQHVGIQEQKSRDEQRHVQKLHEGTSIKSAEWYYKKI